MEVKLKSPFYFERGYIRQIPYIVRNSDVGTKHGLRTPREEIVFTARPRIQSQSQIFRYGRSIFCLPHWPHFSDIFDLCLHWKSVVRGTKIALIFDVASFKFELQLFRLSKLEDIKYIRDHFKGL